MTFQEQHSLCQLLVLASFARDTTNQAKKSSSVNNVHVPALGRASCEILPMEKILVFRTSNKINSMANYFFVEWIMKSIWVGTVVDVSLSVHLSCLVLLITFKQQILVYRQRRKFWDLEVQGLMPALKADKKIFVALTAKNSHKSHTQCAPSLLL